MSDESIRRRVWSGVIPVAFVLAAECATPDIAEDVGQPFFMLLPRISYFTLCAGPLRDHYRQFLPSIDEMWFECNGAPLRWHIPIGALFDSLCKQEELPWKITVHFGRFPAGAILHWTSEEHVRNHFMHSIKEATYLRTGSTAALTSLTPGDQAQLFQSLRTSAYDAFWQVNAQVVGDGALRHVPLRVVVDGAVHQALVPPFQSPDAPHTLLTAVSLVVPRAIVPGLKLLVHGLTPAPDVPVAWLWRTLMWPDAHLYVSLRHD